MDVNLLVEKAKEARKNSYSPYSEYKVGAAVLGKSGKIYSGCNVENASYELAVCAERTAIVKAISEGEKEIEAVAVVTDSKTPGSLCGGCRQMLAEFGYTAKVITANMRGDIKIETLDRILPDAFLPHYLKERDKSD